MFRKPLSWYPKLVHRTGIWQWGVACAVGCIDFKEPGLLGCGEPIHRSTELCCNAGIVVSERSSRLREQKQK